MLSLVRICRFSIDKFPGISQRVCLKFSEFHPKFHLKCEISPGIDFLQRLAIFFEILNEKSHDNANSKKNKN